MDDRDENRLRQQQRQLQASDEVVPTSSSSTKKRWRLLARTISKKPRLDADADLALSVSRRFVTFGLVRYAQKASPASTSGVWKTVSYSSLASDDALFQVTVHFLTDPVASVDDLVGFNNTGNVCVWPAEEVMAYFIGKSPEICAQKRVVELGAGMTGLAGLCAISSKAESILLTDGNEKSVRNLELIISHGKYRNVSARQLRWDVPADVKGLEYTADVVLAADCLFFDEYRQPLLDTIGKLLSSNGVAYIFAPSRSGTFDKFVDLANRRSDLSIEIKTDYDKVVSDSRDEARLKAAVQYTVGKICDEHTDDGRIEFSQEFVAQLAQLTFGFVSDTWAKDLELFARYGCFLSWNSIIHRLSSFVNLALKFVNIALNFANLVWRCEFSVKTQSFSPRTSSKNLRCQTRLTKLNARHAKRSSVNVDDVKLLVRNNPSLLGKLTEQADSIAAIAIVQKEQSAKRKQAKKEEKKERNPSNGGDLVEQEQDVQPQVPAAAPADLDDDSFSNIDWDNFDRLTTSKPSEICPPPVTLPVSSVKVEFDEDDDADLLDFDSNNEFEQPSTSRPAHLDSTRLPVSSAAGGRKTPLNDGPTTMAPYEPTASPDIDHYLSPVQPVVTKDAAKKNSSESVSKRKSEENKERAPAKKSKHGSKNNRSSVGNSTMVNSFEDDDDADKNISESVPKRRSEESKERAPAKKSKHAPNNRSSVGNSTMVNSFEDDDAENNISKTVPKRRSEENKEKAPAKKSKHAPNNSRSSVGNSTLVNSFEDDDDDFV